MSDQVPTDLEILGYFDESLPDERLNTVESALRNSESLRQRASKLLWQCDQGFHTVGAIWRRNRLSCPTRRQLGSYLLDALQPQMRTYVEFHIQTIGCRYCSANLRDLEEATKERPQAQRRRHKFFQSSAGYVRKLKPDR